MSNKRFFDIFGYEPAFMVTAPGRTELGGNHTDHQHGIVLASPVDLYMTAWVGTPEAGMSDAKSDENDKDTGLIRVYSEGYGMFTVNSTDMIPNEDEYGTPASIIRGTAAAFKDFGLTGFDAYITSDIPAGSGLSSSAAFEILIGRICCRLTGREMTPVELAKLGQRVENIWFGKPCGLMDQTACASDGIISIDFRDPEEPEVHVVNYDSRASEESAACNAVFDFHAADYELFVVKCGAGHEDMTDAYAKITQELKAVCAVFGKEYLRDVPENEFIAGINKVRKECGDRAVLRAMHVYDENRRAKEMCTALEAGDIDTYLELVKESGRSSWELLQNVIPGGASIRQEMALTIAYAERILGGKGAVRVHGGGFAGTVQAYVPLDMKDEFVRGMESLLGEGSCIALNI